ISSPHQLPPRQNDIPFFILTAELLTAVLSAVRLDLLLPLQTRRFHSSDSLFSSLSAGRRSPLLLSVVAVLRPSAFPRPPPPFACPPAAVCPSAVRHLLRPHTAS
ncbi:hypothetical protein LINPERPRIM_LOCUS29953, partial [Linum perenne]